MSLPTTKPAQLSIRSFFQSKTPNYAPPPGYSSASSSSSAPRPAPPAATSFAPPPQQQQQQQKQPAESSPEQEPQQPPSSSSSPPSLAPLPASLPREAGIRPVSGTDLNALRRINALLLPVSYPDAFYQRAIDPAASGRFSRVITWAHDGAEPKVVGGVVCRIEPAFDTAATDRGRPQTPQTLYIQSLCLLSPYRSHGLVNAAVDHIVATAVADPSLNVTAATAHVWTENEEGLKWYENRGFQRDGPAIRGYYIKLRPDSAWHVRRPVGASVRNALPSSSVAAYGEAPRPAPAASTTAAIVNLPPMSSSAGPPKSAAGAACGDSSRPPLASGQSYQNQRPETEWNDLPQDMASGLLGPPRQSASAASSRSSSAARKKKDRAYPAAAFGN